MYTGAVQCLSRQLSLAGQDITDGDGLGWFLILLNTAPGVNIVLFDRKLARSNVDDNLRFCLCTGRYDMLHFVTGSWARREKAGGLHIQAEWTGASLFLQSLACV